MEDIVVYGAGGLGREVVCLINKINEKEKKWNFIGFIDDSVPVGEKIHNFGEVLGGIDYLNSVNKKLAVAISIGSPENVKKIVGNIKNDNIYYPNLICPTFDIVDKDSFKIGKGNIIKVSCRVSCDVTFGDFNILNTSDVFGHDAVVGSFNSFMPCVRISGETTIGDCNYFGIGSIVLQGINIGNNVRIGAGSVLMRNTKDGNLYIGNPAKLFKF